MKLKNQTIINSIQGIKILSEKELPYATTLKISKNINILDELLKEYNNEYRKLAEKYLDKENGNFIKSDSGYLIKKGKEKEYSEKLSILNNFENDVNLYLIDSKIFVITMEFYIKLPFLTIPNQTVEQRG